MRHQIVKLTAPSGRFIFCEVIGREDSKKLFLGLDFEDRASLGVDKGAKVAIEVRKVGLIAQTYWYVTNNDPSIRISAILALVSVALGLIGVLLSLKPEP